MTKQKKTAVMIATPMYGGMCTGEYMIGTMSTTRALEKLGVDVHFAILGNESLITRARNELARVFLESDAEYLMFIDADIAFSENSVSTLMAANKDIICGIYPKKDVDWKNVERAAKAGETALSEFSGSFVLNPVNTQQGPIEVDKNGIIEVRHGGTGFMLIKRRVFLDLIPYVPTYRVSNFIDPETGEQVVPMTHEFFATSIDKTGTLLSEDYHFCDLWRKQGGKVYAHTAIKLGHIGNYVYSGNLFRSGINPK